MRKIIDYLKAHTKLVETIRVFVLLGVIVATYFVHINIAHNYVRNIIILLLIYLVTELFRAKVSDRAVVYYNDARFKLMSGVLFLILFIVVIVSNPKSIPRQSLEGYLLVFSPFFLFIALEITKSILYIKGKIAPQQNPNNK